ncbi:MAG: ion transporter [Enhygromyxa sp.]
MPHDEAKSEPQQDWRARVHDIIFETDTRAGRLFDIALLAAILLSVTVIALETVSTISADQRRALRITEWVLTGLFTIEYLLRLIVSREPRRYALSLMGIIDLLALIPTYLSLAVADAQALQIIRALRLLRVFRVFQLGTMAREGSGLMRALVASRYKIAVFLATVLIVVVIQGALVYFLEHRVNEGFSSIPRAIYWAIVTLTTVGYGDISPVTVGGQFIAALLMLLGYAIIAVPTGIVSAEVTLTELAHRRAQREAEHHVLLPASAPNSCASAVPAAAIVQGVADAGARVSSPPKEPN